MIWHVVLWMRHVNKLTGKPMNDPESLARLREFAGYPLDYAAFFNNVEIP